MVAAVFFCVLLYLLFCKPYAVDLFRSGGYMSRERTTMLNGILILVVFMRHAGGYMPDVAACNAVDQFCFREVWPRLGQLLVAGFFLYSGYGIMESITKRGWRYLETFPRQRFLKVLLHFDIAVLCYLPLSSYLGRGNDWDDILLSLVAWKGMGNSHWFIFVTLMLYFITYVSFYVGRRFWSGRLQWWGMWGGTFLLAFVLMRFKFSWWYDTLLCFPAGMFLSSAHCYIKKLILIVKIPPYVTGMILCATGFLLLQKHMHGFWIPNLCAIMVAYGVALLGSGIAFRRSPKALLWLGTALFSIYLFHMMPLKVLAKEMPVDVSPSLYILCSLVLSLVFAAGAERLYRWVDGYCFAPAPGGANDGMAG